MKAAPWPRSSPQNDRLIALDPTSCSAKDVVFAALPSLLRKGDLLVVNDAATLPASLRGTDDGGHPIEVRLLAFHGDKTFEAMLFGEGDWRTDTEQRRGPAHIHAGMHIHFARDLSAHVLAHSPQSKRLVILRFLADDDRFVQRLFAIGKPVQYAYMADDLSLSDVQTPYASRPMAMEMPSAGRALQVSLLVELRRQGIAISRLTHAAGLSSTGDRALDSMLPFTEHFDIPQDTVWSIERTKAAGGRIIATGTSVVRALEGCFARHHRLVPGQGETSLIIKRGFVPRVVDGVLSGMHEEGTSHIGLLEAFCPPSLLKAAVHYGTQKGLLVHEFGDHCLVLDGVATRGEAGVWAMANPLS